MNRMCTVGAKGLEKRGCSSVVSEFVMTRALSADVLEVMENTSRVVWLRTVLLPGHHC